MGTSISQPQPRFFDLLEPFDVYAVCFMENGRITLVDALYDKMSVGEAHVAALRALPHYVGVEIIIRTIPKVITLQQIQQELDLDDIKAIHQMTNTSPHVWTSLAQIY